jgi:uncharacterized protein (DUF4415 family)
MMRGRIVRLSEEEARAARARTRMPTGTAPEVKAPAKVAISVRLDEDVLAFFRAEGPGYQTRINAVLRSYMQAKSGT